MQQGFKVKKPSIQCQIPKFRFKNEKNPFRGIFSTLN